MGKKIIKKFVASDYCLYKCSQKAPEWTTITRGRGVNLSEQLASLLVQKVRGSFVTPHPCTAPPNLAQQPLLLHLHLHAHCTALTVQISHPHSIGCLLCLTLQIMYCNLSFKERCSAMQCNAKECTAKVKFPRATLCHLLGNPQR